MAAVATVAIGAGAPPRDMDRVRIATKEKATVLRDVIEGLPDGWDSIVFQDHERRTRTARAGPPRPAPAGRDRRPVPAGLLVEGDAAPTRKRTRG